MFILANAGTPLIWFGCLWLFFGNWALGVIEAKLLSRFLGKPIAAGRLIAANYLSMGAGFLLFFASTPIRDAVSLDPIRLGLLAFLGMMAAAWFITILVEWPLLASAAELPMNRRTLGLSAAVQSITYAGMLLITMGLGSLSAITDLRSSERISTVPGWAYTVGLDGTTVFRTRLDGSKSERVGVVRPHNSHHERVLVAPVAETHRAQLIFVFNRGTEVIQEDIGTDLQAAPMSPWILERNLPEVTRSFIGRRCGVYAGYWSRIGLMAAGRRYALETPFLTLPWRSPTVLPDGKIVASFGRAVYLLDPKTGEARKLIEGSAGDVLLDPGVPNVRYNPDPLADDQPEEEAPGSEPTKPPAEENVEGAGSEGAGN